MKHLIIPVIAAASVVGCQQDDNQQKSLATTEVKQPAATGTATVKPAATAKPPFAKEYFEVTKNGKTYVFGKLDSLMAFRKSGTLSTEAIEKPGFGPAGETVVFESGGLETGLMADYAKAHPKK